MKTINVLGTIIFAAAIGSLSFKSGEYYDYYKLKPTLVDKACAHYDMRTGDFTYGATPVAIPQEKASSLGADAKNFADSHGIEVDADSGQAVATKAPTVKSKKGHPVPLPKPPIPQGE